MRQPLFYLIFWLVACSSSEPPAERQLPSKADTLPNILFVLADDMGYGDPQCYNPDSKISTPNIDRLAAEGVRFTDAHASGPWCVPSRYGLLTGQYPLRAQLNWQERALIDPQQLTLASLLQRNGYRTACVGKWHLGFDGVEDWETFSSDQALPGGPLDHGFDTFFGMYASLDIPPYFYIEGDRPVAPPTETVAAHQSEDATTPISGAFWRAGNIAPGFAFAEVLPTFTQKAMAFLENHQQVAGNAPFFLYVPLTAPHTPWVPTPDFQGKSQAGEYGDFTTQVDHVVGQLLQTLEATGQLDSTLIIFASDNGPVWFEQDVAQYDHRSVANLRGMKVDNWEGGHRVPFVARWPSLIPAGAVRSDLLAFTDVLATLAAAVGDSLPEADQLDSYNLLPALRNETLSEPIRQELIIGEGVVRQGDWKLIVGGGEGVLHRQYGRGIPEAPANPPLELYNLKNDLSETSNVYETNTTKGKQLETLLQRVKEE